MTSARTRTGAAGSAHLSVAEEPDEEGSEDRAPAPEHRLYRARGEWGYSTGRDENRLTRGVYGRLSGTWRLVAPLPHVLERVALRDGMGRRVGIAYRLATARLSDAGEVAVVHSKELHEGAWRDMLDMPCSSDAAVLDCVETAVREVGKDAPLVESRAQWSDSGRLELPPQDVRPPGYGDLAPLSAEQATEAWRELAALAVDSPRLALTVGSAIGASCVSPLEVQPHVWLATGTGGQGKTSALTAAAAVYGHPGTRSRAGIVKAWNTSAQGLPLMLGELGCLPAFLDEMGATRMSSQDLEQRVFSICQGASRMQGTRFQGSRMTPQWAGVCFATGNSGIVDRIANDGIARRVVELPPPLVRSGPEADRVVALAHHAYGWPLHWLREGQVTPADVAERVEAATGAIGELDSGLPAETSVRGYLALAVAGADLLGSLLENPGLREAAVQEARERLTASMVALADKGANAGDRLVTAVTDAALSRPGAFPTRALWASVHYGAGDDRLSRDTEGWNVRDEGTVPGDLFVMADALAAIASDAGIEDPAAGVSDCLRDGRMRATKSAGRRYELATVSPAPKSKTRGYLFRLPVDVAEGPDDHPRDDQGDGRRPAPDPERSPVAPPADPRPEPTTGDQGAPAPTCDDTTAIPVIPAIPGSGEQVSREGAVVVDEHGANGPVMLDGGASAAPCRVCAGGPVRTRDDQGPVHPFACARSGAPWPAQAAVDASPVSAPAEAPSEAHSRPQAATEPVSEPAPARRTARPVQARQGGAQGPRRVLAVDGAGVWLPGAGEPVAADEALTSPDAVSRLLDSHGAWLLLVHSSAHEPMGLPGERETDSRGMTLAPGVGQDCPFADAAERVITETGGVAPWTALIPPDERPRQAMLLAAWETRAEWGRAESGRELLAAVDTLNSAMARQIGKLPSAEHKRPVTYYLSPNETGASLVRTSLAATQGVDGAWRAPTIDVEVPDVGARLNPSRWVRPGGLLDEEDVPGAWVHKFDKNGAEPGTAGAVYLATGAFEHVADPQLDPKALKTWSGYVLAQLDRDAARARLDARLPDVLDPWVRVDGAETTAGDPAWITGEHLSLLWELGLDVELVEAWGASSTSRWLQPWAGIYSGGRRDLEAAVEGHSGGCRCGACVALATWKPMFNSRIGDFAPATERRAPIRRRDARDMIKGRTFANQVRALRKVAKGSGRFPLATDVDAVFYVSTEPDPVSAIPDGLTLGSTLRDWKAQGSAPLAAIRETEGWESPREFFRAFDVAAGSIGGKR